MRASENLELRARSNHLEWRLLAELVEVPVKGIPQWERQLHAASLRCPQNTLPPAPATRSVGTVPGHASHQQRAPLPACGASGITPVVDGVERLDLICLLLRVVHPGSPQCGVTPLPPRSCPRFVARRPGRWPKLCSEDEIPKVDFHRNSRLLRWQKLLLGGLSRGIEDLSGHSLGPLWDTSQDPHSEQG